MKCWCSYMINTDSVSYYDPYRVFSDVSSNCLPERMQSHIGCICLTCLTSYHGQFLQFSCQFLCCPRLYSNCHIQEMDPSHSLSTEHCFKILKLNIVVGLKGKMKVKVIIEGVLVQVELNLKFTKAS